jgi:exonuclease VII large subunit
MENDITKANQNVPVTIYKPSEIIGIFNSILAKQSVNAQVVYLRGVYLASGRQSYNGYFYDTLRDEDRQEEITMYVTQQQRENLKNGNLVNVGGVLGRNVNNRGQIQIILNVSRIEIVQEQAIDEDEIKRMELRQKKSSVGFKNVDSVLEQLLFTDQRPRVALLFATSSITMSDFEAGINAAKSAIDFMEYRANFSNAKELISTLQSLDRENFDVIALVRGGGARIESLDDVSVLEQIVAMSTPTIGAIGHVEEKIFVKQLVDKCAPTPNGLGQYFSEMVENVSEKKTRSRAVLTEKIKKQFKDQLEASQKQNKELQEKLKVLTKAQEDSVKAQQEATKKHNEQVQAAQKQNKELQEQLKGIQKSHQEQITKLTEAQKQQQEQQKKQQEELNKSLGKMQESNAQLQKNLAAITTQNTESLKQLAQAKEKAKDLEHQLSEALNNKGGNSSVWMVVAIIAIILLIVSFFLR